MILKRLNIHHFGPFTPEVSIEIDSEVTILTGPNDTGKSSILDLIDIMCNGKRYLEEKFANIDRIYDSGLSWDKDAEIFCIATFILTEKSNRWLKNVEAASGSEVDIKFHLSPQSGAPRVYVMDIRSGKSVTHINGSGVTKYPKVVRLPIEEEVRSIIDVKSLNNLERVLLKLVFGQNGTEKVQGLSDSIFQRQLRQGVQRLNESLNRVQGSSGRFELGLDRISKEPLTFAASLRDTHGGDTPPHLRGTGIRKMISLLVLLLEIDFEANYTYILFDEPENSLHADMQHLLRKFLEEIATHEMVQVIYATHSSAMINPLRADSIRLLERKNANNKAVSIVHNKPYEKSFAQIRASLGISPIDSLIYAPITIIVEGSTEIICIPQVLLHCHEKNVPGFERVRDLLSLSHFLDGEGTSFEYMCRISKSQGCKPIVFADGDQIKRVKQSKIEEIHPEVPIIFLADGQEFEELIDQKIYFEALAEVAGEDIQIEAFLAWSASTSLPSRMAFTKKVDRWLQDTFDGLSLDKPRTMKKALEGDFHNQVVLEPFRRLVKAIEQLLQ